MDEFGIAHQGYMDGLSGRDPHPEKESCDEYVVGYLAGTEDREAGVTAPKFWGPCDVPFKTGDEVVIPKGTPISNLRTGSRKAGKDYKIKVHRVEKGIPAHVDYWSGGKFVRPTAPKIIWAGHDRSWTHADVNDLVG